MGARTFWIAATAGIFVAVAAHADSGSGDIVDAILQGQQQTPAAGAGSPTPLAPMPAAVSLDSDDLVNRTLQSTPPAASTMPSPVPAAAADVASYAPPGTIPEAWKWSGFTLGVNIGGASAGGGSGASCMNSVTGDMSGCAIISNSGIDSSGVIGGGQFGYMRSVDFGWGLPLMIGAEADAQTTGVSGSQNVPGPFNFVNFPGITCTLCGYTANQQLNWLGTLRARVGVPVDNFLIYATGGLAVGGVTTSLSLNFDAMPGYVSNNAKTTLSGFTVGGGVEFLLPGPFSAKLEALFYDLGTVKTVTVPQTNFAGNFFESKTFGFRGAILRLGVNLRLGDIGGS